MCCDGFVELAGAVYQMLAVPEMEWQGIVIQSAGAAVLLLQIGTLNFCLSTSGSTVNVLITNKLQVAWLLFFIVIGKILF